MTRIRGVPAETVRPGDDFEWVNTWAAASGLKAAQRFASEAAEAVPSKQAAPTFPAAPDALERDIAEIARARDALIATERAKSFTLPGPRASRSSPTRPRTRDCVP